jgi:hypothetical protein
VEAFLGIPVGLALSAAAAIATGELVGSLVLSGLALLAGWPSSWCSSFWREDSWGFFARGPGQRPASAKQRRNGTDLAGVRVSEQETTALKDLTSALGV